MWVASIFLSVFQIVKRRLGKLIIKREVYNLPNVLTEKKNILRIFKPGVSLITK